MRFVSTELGQEVFFVRVRRLRRRSAMRDAPSERAVVRSALLRFPFFNCQHRRWTARRLTCGSDRATSGVKAPSIRWVCRWTARWRLSVAARDLKPFQVCERKTDHSLCHVGIPNPGQLLHWLKAARRALRMFSAERAKFKGNHPEQGHRTPVRSWPALYELHERVFKLDAVVVSL